ncbi:MAG: ribosome silencing factor, partial [Bdellovibrionales bacterium]
SKSKEMKAVAKTKKNAKAKKPARKPAVKSRKTAKKPPRKPAKKTVPSPARKPAQKTVRKPAGKPARKTVRKPAPRKAARPVSKSGARPASRSAPKISATPVKIRGGLPGELYQAALGVLADRQAEDVVTFDLEGRSAMADYIVIATGRAARQIAAIADYLRDAFMKLGVKQVRIEGLPEANWVLVDCGDVVVHLFRPEVRSYYRLEDIWNRR